MSGKMKITHQGTLFGVPINIDFTDTEMPQIDGRWFWCNWLLPVMELLFGLYCMVRCWYDWDFEPMFPIRVTKVVDWDGPELGV